MRITIVPEDGNVGVDGEFRLVDMTGLPDDIWAIQFNTETQKGHVEYREDAEGNRIPNESITDFSAYQFMVNRWEDAAPAPEPTPEPTIPTVVSMRQARLALLQAGLLATVNAAIASGGEADKITWEYATEVDRNSPLVVNMSAALNLSSQQLDNLFTLAASL